MSQSAQPFSLRRNSAIGVSSRHVLMAGFGGLLLLMAFAGLDGIQSLQEIRFGNTCR